MLPPSVFAMLRNREPLDPEDSRALRHVGFWALFLYLEAVAFDFVAPELVIVAAVTAILCALFPRLRRQTSFIALHAALIVSMSMTAWHTRNTTLLADLGVMIALVVASHPERRDGSSLVVRAALVLLHTIAVFVDPWCMPASLLTDSHFVARVFAIVMCVSMLFARRSAPRVNVPSYVPPAPPPTRPVSAAEWDRAKR
jgi:hypothetical protein